MVADPMREKQKQVSKLRGFKDRLKLVAKRWVESRSEVERLERKVQQMRALLEHQTRVNEQYRPYYDGTLDSWRKRTKKRIELVERLLGLPDLFAFDVPDDEIPHMLKWFAMCPECKRAVTEERVDAIQRLGLDDLMQTAPRHFVRGEGENAEIACGEELRGNTLVTRSEAKVSCEMCLEVIVTTFPVHWQVDGEMRVACGAKAKEGKSVNMTPLSTGVTCPECKPFAMGERANILRCQRSFDFKDDEGWGGPLGH